MSKKLTQTQRVEKMANDLERRLDENEARVGVPVHAALYPCRSDLRALRYVLAQAEKAKAK